MTNKKEKILFITGSYPTDVCGVGDYTKALFEALKHRNFDYELFYKKQWSVTLLFSYLREIKSKQSSLIHIQYPTEGYGYSFLPLLLMIFLPKKKLIVTVHELSNRTLKAAIYTVLLILQAKIIIVTNEVEKAFINRNFLLKRKKMYVINIGSNIPQSKNALMGYENRKIDIAYFGHIRPIKGIESFLSLVKHFRQNKSTVAFSIIGQSLPNYQSYIDDLKIKSNELDIKLILNGSVDEAAGNLSDCKIAYLPFPDGVSSRRGSLIAAAINGCSIISTYSTDNNTNQFFNQFCYLVKNELEAESIADKLLSNLCTIKNARPLFDVFSWGAIAKKHEEVYNECLHENSISYL